MPFTPKDLGNSLMTSGDSQINAGNNCIKQSGKALEIAEIFKSGARIHTDMDSVEEGTKSIAVLLSPISSKIKSISDAFSDFSIPTIRTTSKTIGIPAVGDIKVITGITIGSAQPLTSVATFLTGIATNIDKIITALTTVATGINDLQLQLPEMRKTIVEASATIKAGGEDMVKAGTAMKNAGKVLAA
jgi:methyl-accepting chemotaxis protein